MISLRCMIVFSLLSIFLVSCGGGGSDNATNNINGTQTPAKKTNLQFTTYSINSVDAKINDSEKTIVINLPANIDITVLTASFTSTASSVDISGVEQVSGKTSNDFTNSVTYTLHGADATTKDYKVYVQTQANAYQIDPAHTGQSHMGGAVNFPSQSTWSINLSGTSSYPLIANGKVFVTTAGLSSGYGTKLYAIDLGTGENVWGPVDLSGTYYWSGIAYDNNTIFVVNYDGLLRTYNAETGSPGWSVKLTGQYAFSSPPTATNGIVYIGGAGSGGTVYAVDETNGNILWTASVANGDNSSPAVTKDGVFVSYPCQVYKFNPTSGAQVWHYSGGCSGGGGKTTAYLSGNLYVRDFDITNYKYGQTIFNATTGTSKGSFIAMSTIPALTLTTEYMMTSGTLRAVDVPPAQNVIWSFAGDGNLVSAPIIIDQYVIVGSSLGNVFALDRITGKQVWSGTTTTGIPAPDEQNVSQPLTGLAAGEGYLVIPAGSKLTAWHIGH